MSELYGLYEISSSTVAQARFLGNTGPDYITGPHQAKDKSQHRTKSHKYKSHVHENQQYPSISTHSLFYIKLANETSCISTDLKQSDSNFPCLQNPSFIYFCAGATNSFFHSRSPS